MLFKGEKKEKRREKVGEDKKAIKRICYLSMLLRERVIHI
jgi:hypothetical protein